ncbi:transposase (plasmid) [Streptomyces sp. NBC_01717]|uniref:transposase n=1 Tax=Streptomyces sp. NBC_01717 TaxID=2975918 RepID=UPI002E2F7E22|nr:transposase [Streptomyces sp. NBC_01717]
MIPFYVVDNGIKWRAMPADFPPWDRVYAFLRRWRERGLIAELHDRLRGKVREYASGCPPRPSSQAGTGNASRTSPHSASAMSVPYARTRSG